MAPFAETDDTPLGTSHFDVLVLGPFALYRDGRPLEFGGWQRKVQTLFRILATSHEKRRSREELIDLLWPEATSDAGGRNLRVVLHMLRRGLGGGDPSPVLSEAGSISLHPAYDWDLDLDRFEQLAASAPDQIEALEEVAGFYRGEPLAEDRYEDWATRVRTRVQRVWRDLCLRLARLHRNAGSPEAALIWLDRVIQTDPLDEEAVRCLVGTLGDVGRRTEAVRRYQEFAQRLKGEMDLSPSRETLDTIARVRSQVEDLRVGAEMRSEASVTRLVPIIPRYPPLMSGRLVGRETELGRILWVLPPLQTVAPRLVMVSGEPGVGKTRLLAEVAERARRAGLLTLAGGCFRHEGRLPYGPIRDALSDYLEEEPEVLLRGQLEPFFGDLAPIVPELRLRFPEVADTMMGTEEDRRLRLFLAVTKALERIAQDSPLVLLLDDLHWADDSTLQLVHFLVRRLSHNRILVVAAYSREDEGPEPPAAALASDMEYSGWATRVLLNPLAETELALVLEEHLRGRCDRSLNALVYARTGGNPLRALQLLRALQQEGGLQRSPQGWRPMPGMATSL